MGLGPKGKYEHIGGHLKRIIKRFSSNTYARLMNPKGLCEDSGDFGTWIMPWSQG